MFLPLTTFNYFLTFKILGLCLFFWQNWALKTTKIPSVVFKTKEDI